MFSDCIFSYALTRIESDDVFCWSDFITSREEREMLRSLAMFSKSVCCDSESCIFFHIKICICTAIADQTSLLFSWRYLMRIFSSH